ncbi:unnamed protein product, partial [Symbiodinium sp. KB8]
TDCVLHVEDNVKLSVQDIAALHSAWIQNPNVHVGLNPLFIQVPSVTEDESQWSAHKVDPLSLAAAYNSMQLNASLLHADWLQLFSRLDSEITIPRHGSSTCEQVFISFVVARYSQTPPLVVIRQGHVGKGELRGAELAAVNSSAGLLDLMGALKECGHAALKHFLGNPLLRSTARVFNELPF